MFVSIVLALLPRQMLGELKEEVECKDALAAQLIVHRPKEVLQVSFLVEEELIEVK